MSKTTHVTLREGGNWIPWTPDGNFETVHSIRFDDGSVWDTVNGWRPNTMPEEPKKTDPFERFNDLAKRVGSPVRVGWGDSIVDGPARAIELVVDVLEFALDDASRET